MILKHLVRELGRKRKDVIRKGSGLQRKGLAEKHLVRELGPKRKEMIRKGSGLKRKVLF